MKIFIFSQYEDNGYCYSHLFNLLNFHFDNVELIIKPNRNEFIDKYFQLVDKDLAIFADYFFLDFSRDEFETIMKKSICKKISIGFDDEYLITASIYLASFMDKWFTFDSVTFEYMRQLGINVSQVPYPVFFNDIKIEKKDDFKYDISFIGSIEKKGRREILEYISIFFPNNYFPGLNNQRISLEEMKFVFSNSRINLNLTQISDTNPYGFNPYYNSIRRGFKGRPFEIGAMGGFCLSEFSPSLSKFLIPNKHIDYFNNKEEAVQKINFYLENFEDRYYLAKNLNDYVFKYCNPQSKSNSFLSEINIVLSNNKSKKINLPANYAFERERFIHLLNNKNFRLFYKSLLDVFFKIDKKLNYEIILTVTSIIINKIKTSIKKLWS